MERSSLGGLIANSGGLMADIGGLIGDSGGLKVDSGGLMTDSVGLKQVAPQKAVASAFTTEEAPELFRLVLKNLMSIK